MKKLNLDVENLKELYFKGESLCSIARKFNTTHKTVAQHLDKNGITRHKKRRSFPRKDLCNKQIVLLIKSGKSVKEVGNMLNTDEDLIRKRAKLAGFSIREFLSRHDENFFSTFNDKSCYWAGFFAADGYITNNNTIGLELKDKEHVEKFKTVVGVNNKIYERIRKNKYLSYSLRFSSRQIEKDLYNNFNITKRKSLSLVPPENMPYSMISHFIRGYFDGDGCVCKNTFQVSFLGTEEMLTWIKHKIQSYCNGIGDPSIFKRNNIYSVNFGGRFQTAKILKLFYRGSTEHTRLDRKYEISIKKYNIDGEF